ncbi:MAG: EamA family transporter [Chloroflexi bacterium]|nr:EamA family transporter [Chloroflexota bacterium]
MSRWTEKSSVARWVAVPTAVVAISTSGILIRLTTAPPLITATTRLFLASAILLAIALLVQRHDLRSLDRRRLALLAASGVLLGFHFALWTTSLFWTSVASAVLLVDTHPVLLPFAARAVLGERTPAGVWIGIGLTLTGAALIAVGDIEVGARALVGDAMALTASAAFAGYLVIGRYARPRLGIAAYAGIVYGVAALTIAVLVLALGVPIRDVSARDVALWMGLVLVPTLGGHTVLNWALRHLPVSVVGVSILGEPVATTVFAWLLLAEQPPGATFLGGPIILVGVYLALGAHEPEAPPAPARTEQPSV